MTNDNIEMDSTNVDSKKFENQNLEEEEEVKMEFITNDYNANYDFKCDEFSLDNKKDELNQETHQEVQVYDDEKDDYYSEDFSQPEEVCIYPPSPNRSLLFNHLTQQVSSILSNSFERLNYLDEEYNEIASNMRRLKEKILNEKNQEDDTCENIEKQIVSLHENQ